MNKINLIILCLVLILFTYPASAKRGCCSWHGGVNHCDSSSGRIVCNDGSFSPSCMCEPNSNNPKFSIPSSQPSEQSQPLQQTQPSQQSESIQQSQPLPIYEPPQQPQEQSSSNSGSATALCMARNTNTEQYFSANGKGETQAAATESAKNNVLTNCEQTSNSPNTCIIVSCTSSQY